MVRLLLEVWLMPNKVLRYLSYMIQGIQYRLCRKKFLNKINNFIYHNYQ